MGNVGCYENDLCQGGCRSNGDGMPDSGGGEDGGSTCKADESQPCRTRLVETGRIEPWIRIDGT